MPHTSTHPYKIFNTTAPQQAGLFSVLLTTEIFPFYLTLLNKNFHNGLIINQLSKYNINHQLNPQNTLLNNFKATTEHASTIHRKVLPHWEGDRGRSPQPGSAVAPQSIQGGTPKSMKLLISAPFLWFVSFCVKRNEQKVGRERKEEIIYRCPIDIHYNTTPNRNH